MPLIRLFVSTLKLASAQPRYSARQTGDIVQLRDSRTDTTVSVMTSLSNAYEMVVRGQNLIRMTFGSVDDFRARPPELIFAGDPPFPALRAFLAERYLPSRLVMSAPDGRGLWVERDKYGEFESFTDPPGRSR